MAWLTLNIFRFLEHKTLSERGKLLRFSFPENEKKRKRHVLNFSVFLFRFRIPRIEDDKRKRKQRFFIYPVPFSVYHFFFFPFFRKRKTQNGKCFSFPVLSVSVLISDNRKMEKEK